MDITAKVRGALGGLERLAASIPGYKGYKEKEMRREADKLLRMHLARQLEEQWRRLPDLQKRLIEAGQLELVDDLEGAVMGLQTIVDRLKTASYGYAGFFDAVKVKEEQLDALHRFDEALLSEVPKVAEGIDKVATAIAAKEGMAEAIAELAATVRRIGETLHQRQDVMLQAS
ncbi:MAG TPA: hypothetical protein EYP09_03200 [Anaerolineae bacterium]|nr:hypothetical protein [Anaerolineae bacterium]